MNDIVIPIGKSKTDYLDLRYALRGIEKHVMNYREIVIVGEKPSWIQGVVHIPHSDDADRKWKERNIWNKFMASCLVSEISESFLATNDDIFIIEDIDATTYPYYYKGTCYEAMLSNTSFYRATMAHTKSFLERRGFKDINADTHTPIIYNKKEFLNTFEEENWLTPWGYGIKSLYCAINKKPMTFMEDCKISKKVTLEEVERLAKGRHVLSCTDAAIKTGLKEFLDNKFPEKSSYEKR